MSCYTLYRSSHPEVFLRKGVLKICGKVTEEHPCQSVISIKFQSNFIKIAFRHGCSPVNLVNISRTLFPKNTSGGLLLRLLLVQYAHASKPVTRRCSAKVCNFTKNKLWHRCFPVNFAKKITNIFFYRPPPVAASDGTFLDYSDTFWRGYPQILSNISVSCNSVYVVCIL